MGVGNRRNIRGCATRSTPGNTGADIHTYAVADIIQSIPHKFCHSIDNCKVPDNIGTCPDILMSKKVHHSSNRVARGLPTRNRGHDYPVVVVVVVNHLLFSS